MNTPIFLAVGTKSSNYVCGGIKYDCIAIDSIEKNKPYSIGLAYSITYVRSAMEVNSVKTRKFAEKLLKFCLHYRLTFVKILIITAVWMIYSLPIIVFQATNASVKILCT